MIWIPGRGTAQPSIYAFLDSGYVAHYPDTWTAEEPETDPTLIPPEGFFQPRRGFGKAWRDFPSLQEQLGWAIEAELTYPVSFQNEARESIPGVGYMTRPEGTILQLVDTNWSPFLQGQ